MRWPRKHWTLIATPKNRGEETSEAMAKAANDSPQRFYSRQAAERARYFYEHNLKLPAKFWVVDTDHLAERHEDPT